MEVTTAPDALPVLGPLLADRIVVVDVGARWGVAQGWDRLGERCFIIGFEPDKPECERLCEAHRGDPRVRFVPVALGAKTGLATLYLTRDRSGSSLYPSSTEAVARHPGLAGGALDVTTIVELTALDDWCAEQAVAVVDAMKVDTQGSELDVLRGAERTLAGVRLIEVEVEFNPLYEGIPLFAELDSYLREQGFVLWKLNNLAHYAQAGMWTHWRSAETIHFDEVMSSYPGGPGQLFWGNAFYVKRQVAYPTEEAGWRQLVRDACIASAHQLWDLASLHLGLAKRTAPPELAGELDAALSAEQAQIRAEAALVKRSTELTGSLLVGFADPSFVGGGWGPAQLLDFGGVRWSGPGRDAWVDLPVSVVAGTRVEVLAVGFMSPEIAQQLAFDLNGVPAALTPSPHEHGTLFAGVVPEGYASPRRFTRLMVHTLAPIPWNVAHPDSPLDIELGCALCWVRLTAPGDR